MMAHAMNGDLTKAMEIAEKIPSIKMNVLSGVRGFVYALGGRRDEAIQILSELKQSPTYVSPVTPGIIHLALGNLDEWRKTMQQAYEERAGGILFMNRYWFLDSVRTDPVYQQIIAKIGLP
jgi:hypothetical protein